MIRDILKALVLGHALPVIGILLSVGVLAWGGYEWRVRAAYHDGYQTGGAVVRDSAKVATKRILARSESTYNHRADSLVRLAAATAPKHLTPAPAPIRLEPIVASDSQLVPTVPLDRFTRVYVERLQQAFLVETPAAYAWKAEDDSVQVIVRQRDSLALSNRQLTESFFAKDTARSLADSIASPALQPSAPLVAKQRRWPWLVAGILAGVAVTRIHH